MSACESGKGKIQREGVVGLPWSFLAAGVDTVIATHWQILDEETKQIVSIFYRDLIESEREGKSISKAQILRQAILKAIKKDPSLRNQPNKWGAFFVVGIP